MTTTKKLIKDLIRPGGMAKRVTKYQRFNDAVKEAGNTGLPHVFRVKYEEIGTCENRSLKNLHRMNSLGFEKRDLPWDEQSVSTTCRKVDLTEYNLVFEIKPLGTYPGSTGTYVKQHAVEDKDKEELSAQMRATLERILKIAEKNQVNIEEASDDTQVINDYGYLTRDAFWNLYEVGTFKTIPREFNPLQAEEITGIKQADIKDYTQERGQLTLTYKEVLDMAKSEFGVQKREIIENMAAKVGIVLLEEQQMTLDIMPEAERAKMVRDSYHYFFDDVATTKEGKRIINGLKKCTIRYRGDVERLKKKRELCRQLDDLVLSKRKIDVEDLEDKIKINRLRRIEEANRIQDVKMENLGSNFKEAFDEVMKVEDTGKDVTMARFWSDYTANNRDTRYDLLDVEKMTGIADIRIADKYLRGNKGWRSTTFNWTTNLNGVFELAKFFRLPKKKVMERIAHQEGVKIVK
jgi:hypothetical protein